MRKPFQRQAHATFTPIEVTSQGLARSLRHNARERERTAFNFWQDCQDPLFALSSQEFKDCGLDSGRIARAGDAPLRVRRFQAREESAQRPFEGLTVPNHLEALNGREFRFSLLRRQHNQHLVHDLTAGSNGPFQQSLSTQRGIRFVRAEA